LLAGISDSAHLIFYGPSVLKKIDVSMGYKIEVLSGVIYERSSIFKDFINKLYNLRKEHPKGTPLNHLCKLLMNSLYGKYGMDPRMTEGVVESFSDAEIFRYLLTKNSRPLGPLPR
jgi:hypothetical protein